MYVCMYVFDCLRENYTKKLYAKMRGQNYVVQTRASSKSRFGILKRVTVKAELWTLEWTVDWMVDWILDRTLD